jgi:Ca2+-binding RTX toxin-like protein
MGRGRLSRQAVVGLALCIAALVLAPSAAHADPNGGASLQFPSQVTVGQTNVPASLTLSNANQPDTATDTNLVCLYGLPCAPGGFYIFPGLDIFKFSAGVGRTGTVCAGSTWQSMKNTARGDPNFGTWTLVTTAALALPGTGSQCTVDFTFDVLSLGSGSPSVSSGSNPPLPISKLTYVDTAHLQCSPAPCSGTTPFFTPRSDNAVTVTAPKCAGAAATQVGSVGPDKLSGTRRRDVIVALDGNDTIRGLGGNDLLCGGAGNDTLTGGDGKDTLLGQGGADTVKGGDAKDLCIGGKGKDSGAACENRKGL